MIVGLPEPITSRIVVGLVVPIPTRPEASNVITSVSGLFVFPLVRRMSSWVWAAVPDWLYLPRLKLTWFP